MPEQTSAKTGHIQENPVTIPLRRDDVRATLDMIGITTHDMAASLRFYALLGVEVPSPGPEEPFAECTLPGGLRLSWNTVALVKTLVEDWVEPVGHRMGLAFLCDDAAAVDAMYATVVDAGFTGVKPPWDAFWGQRYAQVADPDGNLVDLFAWLPAAAGGGA